MTACAPMTLFPVLRGFSQKRAVDLMQVDAQSISAKNALFACVCTMIAARPTEAVHDFRVSPAISEGGKGERLLSILAIGRVWAKMLVLDELSEEELQEHIICISSEFWTALIAADVDFDEIEMLLEALETQVRTERARLPIHVHPPMGWT